MGNVLPRGRLTPLLASLKGAGKRSLKDWGMGHLVMNLSHGTLRNDCKRKHN